MDSAPGWRIAVGVTHVCTAAGKPDAGRADPTLERAAEGGRASPCCSAGPTIPRSPLFCRPALSFAPVPSVKTPPRKLDARRHWISTAIINRAGNPGIRGPFSDRICTVDRPLPEFGLSDPRGNRCAPSPRPVVSGVSTIRNCRSAGPDSVRDL